jgi:hypothetical protein
MLVLEQGWAESRAFISQRHLSTYSAGNLIDDHISNDERSRILNLLEFGATQTNRLELEATYARFERISILLRDSTVRYTQLATELRVLREAVDDELQYRRFYYYEKEKAKKLLVFHREWEASNEKFPAAKDDAFSATDCYAMGQPDACVFHCVPIFTEL